MIKIDTYSSLWEKILYRSDPDLYIAENIADYKENAPSIKPKKYNMILPLFSATVDIALINVYNLSITHVKLKKIISDKFILHDSSAETIVFWNKNNRFSEVLTSFEESGLKDNDWVYNILILYSIKEKSGYIIDVKKDYFSRNKSEKESLLDKIKDILSSPQPIFQY